MLYYTLYIDTLNMTNGTILMRLLMIEFRGVPIRIYSCVSV